VVCDFRTADVAAGGEGGPLARIHHRALVRRLAAEPPVAVLNVGGVANVTYIDRDALIACDTGPSNALVDDFLRLRTDRLLDTGGRMAQAGAIDEAVLARFLAHPFFAKPLPKSLDRNDFRFSVGATLDGCGVEDGAAAGACARRNRRRCRGRSIDALEAQVFAYLAVRSLCGEPISPPTVTGVPRPLSGGVLARP